MTDSDDTPGTGSAVTSRGSYATHDRVDIGEAAWYGGVMIVYLSVYLFVGGVISLFGLGLLVEDLLFPGSLLLFAGVLVASAGWIGIAYKLIADGVRRGRHRGDA